MTEPLPDDLPKPKWTWSGFWERFKSKDLDGKDDEALFWRIFMPIVLLGVIALLLIDVECEAGDWMTDVTLTYLGLPFTILGWLLAYRSRAWRKHWGEKLWLVSAPILLGWAAAYSMGGFPIWANALLLEEDLAYVYVVGPVIDQQEGQSRFTGFNYYLTIMYEGRRVCLNVSQADYRSHPVGATYGREMLRGRYGYFYQWAPAAFWK